MRLLKSLLIIAIVGLMSILLLAGCSQQHKDENPDGSGSSNVGITGKTTEITEQQEDKNPNTSVLSNGEITEKTTEIAEQHEDKTSDDSVLGNAEIAGKIAEITESEKYYGDLTLAEKLEKNNIPAISIAIIDNYQISGVFTYGSKNKETKEKVTADTLFQAASISKSVFAVAVMRLVEKGTLDLDMDITEYLIDYKLPTYDGKEHKITLRQILSHNAGLNVHGFEGYRQNKKKPTIENILNGSGPANSARLELAKAPETGFQYSGGGFILAQKIVTDVCGYEFIEIMNELALFPFVMTSSTFLQPLPDDRLKEIAHGYNAKNQSLPGGYNIMPELAAAGLWTTPSDLARFGIEVMRAIKGESTLLGKESARSMLEAAYGNPEYGLGFQLGYSRKGKTFGHDGHNYGYLSKMQFCPAEGSGIVIMQNSDGSNLVLNEVFYAFWDVYGW
ncbi:MAG: beta-lactamase family protein [Clostridiales bacterium]|nr:beta-lactamase family protein [Clostridiales bacterium]